MLYVREVCDTMSYVDSVMHEVGCTGFIHKKPIGKKILRTYYLCSLGIKVLIVFARR